MGDADILRVTPAAMIVVMARRGWFPRSVWPCAGGITRTSWTHPTLFRGRVWPSTPSAFTSDWYHRASVEGWAKSVAENEGVSPESVIAEAVAEATRV